MEVYRDFGVHNMFASSLILEHAKDDERFSRTKLYKEGKHYPRPMRCVNTKYISFVVRSCDVLVFDVRLVLPPLVVGWLARGAWSVGVGGLSGRRR